jgi:hypothetical protein
MGRNGHGGLFLLDQSEPSCQTLRSCSSNIGEAGRQGPSPKGSILIEVGTLFNQWIKQSSDPCSTAIFEAFKGAFWVLMGQTIRATVHSI